MRSASSATATEANLRWLLDDRRSLKRLTTSKKRNQRGWRPLRRPQTGGESLAVPNGANNSSRELSYFIQARRCDCAQMSVGKERNERAEHYPRTTLSGTMLLTHR